MKRILTLEMSMATTPTTPTPFKFKDQMIWRSRWYDDQGERRSKYFGYCDEVSTRQATAAYKAWMHTWHRVDRVRNPAATAHTYTVGELAFDYLEHAKQTFLKNGKITSHVYLIKSAMQVLMDTWNDRPASSIEAPELASLRDSMIDAPGDGRKAALKTVNSKLQAIKASYQWARERGLVTRDAALDLASVKRLQKGRSDAVDPKEIGPVDRHWVDLTIQHANPVVADMIEMQWLTGMRPGEVVVMRAIDIDRRGKVWLYTPASHKMEHKDKSRTIALGPKAQELAKRRMGLNTSAYLFAPPGGGQHYRTASYRRSIEYTLARMRKKKIEVPDWSPNQLRHSWGTRVRQTFGLEAASDGLGHSHLDVTVLYAEQSLERAKKVALKIG